MFKAATIRHKERGVSLVEALVALAVMSIGLLGVVGMQATLRTNADVSRQRSEAVRMAQEKVESLRAFTRLDGAAGTELDYTHIASSSAAEDVTPSSGRASATFKRTVTVASPGTGAPSVKTVTVAVQWWDKRADVTDASDPNIQQVVLSTAIARVDPALGASLGIPTNRSATQRPQGRSISIPPAAADQSNGTSLYFPPGSGGARWFFDNGTGRIVQIGTTTLLAVRLSGYIRFATGSSQPTGAQSEVPPGNTTTVGVNVSLTAPALAGSDPAPECYVGAPDSAGAVPYDCAVPIFGSAHGYSNTFTWSGRSTLTSLTLATSVADATASSYRVCRYTPDAGTDTPAGGNATHPLDYASVGTALTNQNFLVIRAGDGTTAFTCPIDDSSTPLVDGDTRRHQPLT
jgi:hypothetical protein